MLSYSIYLTDWAITSLFFVPLGWLPFMEFRNKKQISCAVRIPASISAQYIQTYGFFNFLYFTPVKNWCIHLLENESRFLIHKLVLNIFKQINMLVVGNVIQLHFPRLLFQSTLFMGLVGSIFQETTLGTFPLQYCPVPRPLFFLSFSGIF